MATVVVGSIKFVFNGKTVCRYNAGSSVECCAIADAAPGDRKEMAVRIPQMATMAFLGNSAVVSICAKRGMSFIFDTSVHAGSDRKACPSDVADVDDDPVE